MDNTRGRRADQVEPEGGLALLLEEGNQRMVLPLGRRGRARSSLEGTFAHQVHQAEQEAEVRRQL